MEILGGPMYAVAGAGESHGPALVTTVFGTPAGLHLSREAIQKYLDRRRPGGNKHGTPRNEKDRVAIMAGLYNDDYEQLLAGPQVKVSAGELAFETISYDQGYTTGEPIAAIVLSSSKKSEHYQQFKGDKGEVRPGHTDLVKYHKSKGYVDIRGGGRSSYRSTVTDVIGGSIARLFLADKFGTIFLSSIRQIGELRAETSLYDVIWELSQQHPQGQIPVEAVRVIEEKLEQAPIHSIDDAFCEQATELIKQTRVDGDSIGALLEVVAVNVPALIGEPLYNSLKLRLMGALGGLHAVQSCEMGDGRDVVSRLGSQNNDPIRSGGYAQNAHGGLIGGVTTGNPLAFRVGFKPTSTINKQQQSVRKDLEEISFELNKGRHDPCVGVRAGVTLESRMAIEVMNAVLMHQAHWVDEQNYMLFEQGYGTSAI